MGKIRRTASFQRCFWTPSQEGYQFDCDASGHVDESRLGSEDLKDFRACIEGRCEGLTDYGAVEFFSNGR